VLIVGVLGAAGDAAAPAEELNGDDIYRRVLDNRFYSFSQRLKMISGDKAGNSQDVELDLKYLSFRDQSDKILSKSIAKYRAPQDVRHLGYLVVNKVSGPDDQFVYMPSARRVRRVNLRGESVAGTDFSMEDIFPREFEDSTYRRLPDEPVDGITCYVVEVTPNPETDSEYSKFVAWVDREKFVTLRNRYWDANSVLIKELTSKIDTLTQYEDVEKGEQKLVWMARESKIVNQSVGSYTVLEIVSVKPNPGLKNRDFTERQLTRGR
jgi:hypothetical protein